jgi:hypothetical protein
MTATRRVVDSPIRARTKPPRLMKPSRTGHSRVGLSGLESGRVVDVFGAERLRGIWAVAAGVIAVAISRLGHALP